LFGGEIVEYQSGKKTGRIGFFGPGSRRCLRFHESLVPCMIDRSIIHSKASAASAIMGMQYSIEIYVLLTSKEIFFDKGMLRGVWGD
jgi:hypothetical protein